MSDIDAASNRFALLELDPWPSDAVPVVPPVVPPVAPRAESPAAIRMLVTAWALALYALGQWYRAANKVPPAPGVWGAMLAPVAPVTAPMVFRDRETAPTTPVRTDIRLVAYDSDNRGRPVAGRLAVVTPFNRGFVAAVKVGTDAQWDSMGACVPAGTKGVWAFDVRNLPIVRRALMECYGYDGGPLPTVPTTEVVTGQINVTNVVATAVERRERERLAAIELQPSLIAAAERAAVAPTVATVPSETFMDRVRAARVANGGSADVMQRAPLIARTAVSTVAEVRAAMTDGTIIGGAAVEGQGGMVGWNGEGPLSYSVILGVLASVDAPAEWTPERTSAHAHAGIAVGLCNNYGQIARVDRGLRKNERRNVAARWIVGPAPAGGEVGDTMGPITVTVSLSPGETLTYEGNTAIGEAILARYRALRTDELFNAGRVTAWLQGVIKTHLHGIQMGPAMFVRSEYFDRMKALTDALRAVWDTGDNWMPAHHVATCSDIRGGMAKSLVAEAEKVLRLLETERTTARAATPPRADIGPVRAATHYASLKVVGERCSEWAKVIGPENVAHVRTAVTAALAYVEPLCSDGSQRGAMIELD